MSTPGSAIENFLANLAANPRPAPETYASPDPGAAYRLNGLVPIGTGTVPAASDASGSGGSLFSGDQTYAYSPFTYQQGDGSSGSLTYVLPTDILNGNTPGADFNFNLGPTADTIAANAYAFDANQAQNAFGFLGNVINQTQSYVTSEIAPLISTITNTGADYFQQILGAFTGTGAASQSLNTQGINAITGIANNAIGASVTNANTSASTAAASAQSSAQSSNNSGGGFCYITTAVCEFTGESDTGRLLTTLRVWRNTFLLASEFGRCCVTRYYREAPTYVRAIDSLPANERAFVYHALRKIIRRSASAIRRGDNARALAYYVLGVSIAKRCAEFAVHV